MPTSFHSRTSVSPFLESLAFGTQKGRGNTWRNIILSPTDVGVICCDRCHASEGGASYIAFLRLLSYGAVHDGWSVRGFAPDYTAIDLVSFGGPRERMSC